MAFRSIRSLICACITSLFFASWFALSARARAGDDQTLWQIGTADKNDAEFALADGSYTNFVGNFGSPDHAFYIGLSNPKTDWPCILPGPFDRWAGSFYNKRNGNEWDQMNTLPIGFVLGQISTNGQCALVIAFCDSSPGNPPGLRITINGVNFERDLSPGGSDNSLNGDFSTAKPQTVRVQFPASLLKKGYNEVALRAIGGSWCLFDALQLDAPAGATLAPPSQTVIRSVTAPAYAVSPGRKTPATVRVELYCAGAPGNLEVQIGGAPAETMEIQPSGLQTLEIPAPASKHKGTTHIRVSSNGQLLCETDLHLQASPPVTPSDYVNVFMGTAHSRWMIAPGPWMPFGMVKIAPDNQPECWCSGYDYTHEYINCFSHIHEWTMAGLGMMPTVGPLRTHPGLDGAGYSSRFDRSTEHGGIGYYDVFLKDSRIKVELTATTRASLQRYTFPASDEARVLIPLLLPNEYRTRVLSAHVRRTGANEIEGSIKTDVPGPYGCDQNYTLHFVSQFSRPFEALGGWENQAGANVIIKPSQTWSGDGISDWPRPELFSNVLELAMSGDCGAFVNFKTAAGEQIEVRTAISLVSVDNARQNLKTELSGPFGWDFAAVVENQRKVWNELFNRVEIQAPDAREKTRFYSNVYRAFSGRNIWSDANGQWVDPSGRVQKLRDPKNVMLGCDALWTTFWNLNPLMNLMAPDWSARWTKSELQLYEKCGWLAKGPAGLKYISVMVAEHEIPLMVAAYQAGIRGLDPEEILAAAVKMQTSMPQSTPGGGKAGNENLAGYLKYGYVPVDGPLKGHPSNTFEYAYDDWTVAQLALALGHRELAMKFLSRSQNWRNSFDIETGFARPRMSNGDWRTPFQPMGEHSGPTDFTEANAWQYTWFVPQDVPGLVSAMGRDRFVDRLNGAFEMMAPKRFNATSGINQDYPINQGNETCMQVSWLFNWAGEPWLTEKWTHDILEAYYGYNAADAYLGDEDQGQMASWFLMCAMGLFQTDGGCRMDPIYEIATPLYPKTTIHLSKKYYGGKSFTIEAKNLSPENMYIQSATLDGKPLNQWWIRQRDVLKGGELVLNLGPEPNKDWARDCPLPNP
ncbi:MAG TPA: GH92 family glycosyl hydrolase [Verrucomicrobiae bacterium]|jgi:predicted alpha-1,2-mannosidase|nr:GH92 family glycosyl hydrolase [Verrucomicrobiae bacterium]